jgi:hypothetical protein
MVDGGGGRTTTLLSKREGGIRRAATRITEKIVCGQPILNHVQDLGVLKP